MSIPIWCTRMRHLWQVRCGLIQWQVRCHHLLFRLYSSEVHLRGTCRSLLSGGHVLPHSGLGVESGDDVLACRETLRAGGAAVAGEEHGGNGGCQGISNTGLSKLQQRRRSQLQFTWQVSRATRLAQVRQTHSILPRPGSQRNTAVCIPSPAMWLSKGRDRNRTTPTWKHVPKTQQTSQRSHRHVHLCHVGFAHPSCPQ